MNSEPRHPCFVEAYVQVLGTSGNKIQRTNSVSTINRPKQTEKEIVGAYQHGND
jgi:hypothetical protein